MSKRDILPTQPITMDKPQLDYWKGEVRSSLKRQKEEFIQAVEYNKAIKYLEGQQGKQSWTIIDEFSPAILSVVTNVYYQNPTVQVEAKNPDADKMVQPSLMYLLQHPEFKPFSLTDLLKGAEVYAMDKIGMKEEMQIAAFDLMLAAYAAVEVNQTSETAEQTPTDVPIESSGNMMADKFIEGVKGVGQMIGGALGLTKKPEDVEEEVAATTQKDIRTDITSETYCKRWNPLDILFDPRARVFKESRWLGKIVRMSLAEFNAKYPKFKGKVSVGDDNLQDMDYSSFEQKENRKSVTLYEVEIKKRGPRNCVLVIAMSLDEPVDYYERPIISNNFAVKVRCLDKYGKIYPMSRARKAMRNQDDINHYMTRLFEHVDKAQRKIAVYEDGLTESGKAAQASSDVYAIVNKKTPQAVYEVMPAPQVVPENNVIVEKCTDNLNKTVGTTELAKSGQSENDTLGQDELQTQAFQSNINAVQDALADLADDCLDELKDIIMQTWDGEDYFRVTGIQGGDAWYDPSMGPLADLLLGDYMVKSNITSAQRPNPMRDRKEFMEFATFVTSPPMVQFAMMHGKRPSMEILNNAAKKFEQNPEMVWEEIELATPPSMPGGAPPPPGIQPIGARPVEAEGSRIEKGVPA